jgi:hypothetical protein
LPQVGLGVGGVRLCAGRVGLRQPIADVGDVGFDQQRVEPEVRIALGMLFGVVGGARNQPLRGGDHQPLPAGVGQHALQPGFQPAAVDHQHLRGGHAGHVLRRGFEGMRIYPGRDQAAHRGALAGHLARQIGEKFIAGQHLHLAAVGSLRLPRAPREKKH